MKKKTYAVILLLILGGIIMYERVNWQNSPSTATPVSADNLNKMDKGIADIDSQLADIAIQVDKSTSDDTMILNTAINATAGGRSAIVLTENQDFQADSDLATFDNGIILGKGKLLSANSNNRYADIYNPRKFSGFSTQINPAYRFENISKFAKALTIAKAGGTKVKVCFVGDSLTQAGHRIADNFWWVKHLEEKLTEQFGDYFTFYNRGYAGRGIGNLPDVINEPINAPYETDWVTSVGIKTWISYIDDVDPDIVFCAFGMNEVNANSYKAIEDGRALLKGISSTPDVVWVTSPIRTINTSVVYNSTSFGTYPDNEYSNNAGILTRLVAMKYGDACIDVNRNASIVYLGLDPYQYRIDRWFGKYRDTTNKFYAPDGAITGGGADAVNMAIGIGTTISSKRLFRNTSLEFTPTGTLIDGLRIWFRRDTKSDNYTMVSLSNSDILVYGYSSLSDSMGVIGSWSGDCRSQKVRVEVIGVSVSVYVADTIVIDINNNLASQFLAEIAFQSMGTTDCVLNDTSINEDIYKKYIPRISANEVFNVQYGDGGNGLNHPNTLGELELFEQPINEFVSGLNYVEYLSGLSGNESGALTLDEDVTGTINYFVNGKTVVIHFNDISGSFGSAGVLTTLPSDILPQVAVRDSLSRAINATQDIITLDARPNGNVYAYNTPIEGATYSGTMTYILP